ncbi:MAG: T9SS type A sorting domain-containing protein [Bacteroidetes bacterium]|nr:T9SS type A sorting domain-containing protein [Bacteroidota bacterium]
MKNFIFYLIMIAFSINTLSQTNKSSINDSLVAYWPFNGNAIDSTGNGNDGIVYGATLTTDRFGNPNSAYSFDGISNYISLESNSKLNLDSSSRTICAWIKTPSSSTQSILSKQKRKTPFTGYCFDYNEYSNKGLVFAVVEDYSTNQYIKAISSENLADDNWHFVAATYNSKEGNMRLYADCQLLTDTSVFGLNGNYDSDFSCSLEIGSRGKNDGYNTGSLFFHGKIDDIKIFKRELSIEELNNLCTGNVNIKDNDKENILFSVYPNPASNLITIKTDSKEKNLIIIYNINGDELIKKQTSNSTSQIDLSKLDNGVYFVKILTSHNVVVKKIIKE